MSQKRHQKVKEARGEPVDVQLALAMFGDLHLKNPAACRVAERIFHILVFNDVIDEAVPEITTDVELTLSAERSGPKSEFRRLVGLLVGLLFSDRATLLDIVHALEHCYDPVDITRYRAKYLASIGCKNPQFLANEMLKLDGAKARRSKSELASAQRKARRILYDEIVAPRKRGRPLKKK